MIFIFYTIYADETPTNDLRTQKRQKIHFNNTISILDINESLKIQIIIIISLKHL